eukprot:GHVU01193592.1.p3 GENE.GHVU01193592.1~~GHVU01193592.1.p3  ORF type:complete len:104 (-),score=20.67 GHVU01193592.1:486-797(-)
MRSYAFPRCSCGFPDDCFVKSFSTSASIRANDLSMGAAERPPKSSSSAAAAAAVVESESEEELLSKKFQFPSSVENYNGGRMLYTTRYCGGTPGLRSRPLLPP